MYIFTPNAAFVAVFKLYLMPLRAISADTDRAINAYGPLLVPKNNAIADDDG